MREALISIAMLLAGNSVSLSQQLSNDTIYESYQVDHLPQLYVQDSIVNIQNYILQNLKWKEGMNEGEKIELTYVVDRQGIIRNIDIINMPRECQSCTKEFIRIFTSVPALIPAKKENNTVSVKQKMIFHFNIER